MLSATSPKREASNTTSRGPNPSALCGAGGPIARLVSSPGGTISAILCLGSRGLSVPRMRLCCGTRLLHGTAHRDHAEEAEEQKSCHPLRELSLSGSTSPPQTRQCSCCTQGTAFLIFGEFLLSPLILAEHGQPPFHQNVWNVTPGYPPFSIRPC